MTRPHVSHPSHAPRSRSARARWHPTLLLAFAAVAVAGCGDDEQAPDETGPGLANPASVHCVEQGGELEIVDEPAGQVGYCSLPDGRRIEEWELYRAETGSTSGP